mgnify:CR=1 FL=1
MRGLDTALQAFYSLLLNRMRTLLTVVGLSVGVGAIIAIGSIGYASLDEVQQELNRFGVDRLWVSTSGEDPLSLADVSLLDRQLPGGSFCPMLYGSAAASTQERSKSVEIVGTTQAYAEIENFQMQSGRFLRPEDEDRGLRVAVIEDLLADFLFPGQDPVGQCLHIGSGLYTVVGVMETSYSQVMNSGNTPKVFVPLSAFEQQYGVVNLNQIVAKMDGTLQKAASSIRSVLSAAHGGQGYTVSSMEGQIQSAERIMGIFRMVLLCVGAICMLTGGIGVMNVLLASLKERRREIGVRKALGAKDRDIAWQFVCEAVLYGFLGACLGLALGRLFTQVGAQLVGVEAAVRLDLSAAAILFSCSVSLVFGVYPAVRASKVPPVLAMRSQL